MENKTIIAKANFSRGQAALENLIMVGFALAFIVPLAFLFLSSTGTQSAKTSIDQAQVTARTIADTAGEIYLQGPGAKKTILVNYPDGVTGGSVGNGVVVLSILVDGRQLDIPATTFASVSGDLSGKRNPGLQRIRMENTGYEVYVKYE
ncbi:MAG: hypothetical protein NTV88_03440 [Candidatus Micrarchaeota archaeon]|nr:hypothetical protein [Candidatus Micrarchaeota archaeon]